MGLVFSGILAAFLCQSGALLPEAGPAEGVAKSRERYLLRNDVLEAKIAIDNGVLQPLDFTNRISGLSLPLPAYAFQAKAQDSNLTSNQFYVRDVNLAHLEGKPNASQLSQQESGWRIIVHLDGPMEAKWSIELRDGSNYVKIALHLEHAASGHLTSLCLLNGVLKGGTLAGKVEGVPIVSDDFFFGIEHPTGSNAVNTDWVYTCCLQLGKTNLSASTSRATLVLGASVPGQTRRSFLQYLERERAHPSRRMLHYNTWYDIGTGQTYSAKEVRSRLQEIANQLGQRGLALDAFLLDDGWDDPDTGPWEPHAGFNASELLRLEETARHLKTGLGMWFSPFGGYHEPRQRRVKAARLAGIPVREEVRERIPATLRPGVPCSKTSPCGEGEGSCRSNDDCKGQLECWHTTHHVSPPGIDLSTALDADVCFDPSVRSSYLGLGIAEYYKHLHSTLLKWISKGARLFKLDGIGNPSGMSETLQEDFMFAMTLIATLRQVKSDIFINLSTGTWPSPFWLLHSDTVWRRGHDHYFEGPPGPTRERWITYRDAMVHQNVVLESPLFPLNSLMIHGIIFAQDAWDLNAPEGSGTGLSRNPFKNEVRSAFGSGAMLQELYLTPSLLTSENWDDLAEAALWASGRLDVLSDVQWFGGDPAKGQIYGWAAWWQSSAILTLRNPSTFTQVVELDVLHVFNLPNSEVATTLQLNTPFPDQRPRQISLQKGQPAILTMPPYAVFVFDSGVPSPSTISTYTDAIDTNYASLLLWTSFSVAVATWFMCSRPSGPTALKPSGEELRRLRLQALERGSFGTHRESLNSVGAQSLAQESN
ncbi:Pentatricopeptide repeat-containing protein [Durusdinium trenchii]